MSINLKQFKYVLLLSETGSFSKTADILNISQPSLSQYIKKIEKDLGAELFIRANGEVRLTDAGHIYIGAGKKILNLEHQMENRLADLSDYKGGTITIGISPYRSVHMMPRVLKEFDECYPDIKLVVKEKSGSDLIEGAYRGEFDICIIALPSDDKVFNREILHKEEIVIAVNKETAFYEKLNKNAKKIADRKFPAVDIHLADGEKFASLSRYMPVRTITDKILNRFDVKVREKIELSSNEALLSIVESGVCAAFVPSGVIDFINDRIAFFSLAQIEPIREVAAISRKDQYKSKPMELLIKILKKLR